MAVTHVMFKTDAAAGSKLDPAVQAEIDLLAPSSLDAGDVHTTHLATGAVTEPKIGTGAVTTTKIGAAAVVTGNIADGAVTAEKIGAAAVTGAKAGTGVCTAEDHVGNYIAAGFVALTTAQYDALDTGGLLDPNMFYMITA